MAISVFDLFKIGIGPSSSHTVGPMQAACRFALTLKDLGQLDRVDRIQVALYGALGATGKGHGTDRAIMLGLEGESPETVDVETIEQRVAAIRDQGWLQLSGAKALRFDAGGDLVFHRRKTLPYHSNGMRFRAFDHRGDPLAERTCYSVGGGFVVDEQAVGGALNDEDATEVAFPFSSAAELLALCAQQGLSISELMLRNEQAWRDEAEVRQGLLERWAVMQACVERGCRTEGVLPGGMKVRRRAAPLYRQLISDPRLPETPLGTMDWVNLFALAVNEENAAGGRVVTAPTNGAAGIIPAVLHYYWQFMPGVFGRRRRAFSPDCGGDRAAVQAERIDLRGRGRLSRARSVPPARWRPGRLTEVMGGTPEQVENAAEIGMEHNLGLTCDPVGGLVQVPCIERNAMAAVKAINACAHGAAWRRHALRLAGQGDQDHARDRRRHEDQIQGDGARRPGCQRDRVLNLATSKTGSSNAQVIGSLNRSAALAGFALSGSDRLTG